MFYIYMLTKNKYNVINQLYYGLHDDQDHENQHCHTPLIVSYLRSNNIIDM